MWTAALHDPAVDRVLFVDSAHTFEQAALSVFEALAAGEGTRGTRSRLPTEGWTDSFPVYEALEDALASLEVSLLCREGLTHLEECGRRRRLLAAGAGQGRSGGLPRRGTARAYTRAVAEASAREGAGRSSELGLRGR